jgi:hypothetical protein
MNIMQFTVEKGISRKDIQPRALKYPWPLMSVGDSFLVPLAAPDRKIATGVTAAGAAWSRRHGDTFSLEWQAGPPTGYRVWRVA